MNWVVFCPILIPFATAIACLFVADRLGAQRFLSVLGAAGLLASAIVLMATHANGEISPVNVAGWDAPYGITLVADGFAAIMVLLNAICGFACVVYGLGSTDAVRERHGYHICTHTLLAAVSGAFLAGDLFNLFVWFEVMLISSFVLITLGGTRGQLEGGIKYVTLNLISSTVFLCAVGLLYGVAGTLNMADLGFKLRVYDNPGVMSAIAVLFVVCFGIKAGTFPFFFWLPASYHTPPFAVSALFSGLLTKVGVYALVRVFTVVFGVGSDSVIAEVLIWTAGLTMVTGVLGAAAQFEVRRILSFHIISQIGYMIMGLAVAAVALGKANVAEAAGLAADAAVMKAAATISIVGTVFYILHHIIVKTNLFLIAGIIHKLTGSNELKSIGGLYKKHPMLGVLFLIPALSLSGIPILSGFWSKLTLVRGGLEAETWGIVATSLCVSILTLYSMTKIWAEAFWKNDPRSEEEQHAAIEAANNSEFGFKRRTRLVLMTAPAVVLACLTLVIGFGAGPAFELSERAAGQLLEPDEYIEAVLPPEYLAELRELETAIRIERGEITPKSWLDENATVSVDADSIEEVSP
ncbi:MAG: proton-conducting transporter membrane subunit [Planctomycetota bacterium]